MPLGASVGSELDANIEAFFLPAWSARVQIVIRNQLAASRHFFICSRSAGQLCDGLVLLRLQSWDLPEAAQGSTAHHRLRTPLSGQTQQISHQTSSAK